MIEFISLDEHLKNHENDKRLSKARAEKAYKAKIGVKPKYHEGKYGSQHDIYTCSSCGSTIMMGVVANYCESCGYNIFWDSPRCLTDYHGYNSLLNNPGCLNEEKLSKACAEKSYEAEIGVKPKFHKGKYGTKYDSYTCRNCGSTIITGRVTNYCHNYCCNCGYKILWDNPG